MSFFRYGRDYYTDATAEQLLAAGAWLFAALVGVFIAVHLLRRSTGHPIANTAIATLPPHVRALSTKSARGLSTGPMPSSWSDWR